MKTGIFNIALLILTVAVLSDCKKEEGICVGSTGKVIIQERPAAAFHHVEVYDNINLFLAQDTNYNQIKVEAGENLIDGITTEIDHGRLKIRNQNSCNWLRSFNIPVNVYIKFRQIDTLITHAAGNITGTNKWNNDLVNIVVEEGGGSIDLDLNVFKSYLVVKYGTFDLNFKGYSQVTFISDLGYGPFNAENLDSKFTYIYTGSPNDIKVTAYVELTAEIRNAGNVYYRGDPVSIHTELIGGGKLIKF